MDNALKDDWEDEAVATDKIPEAFRCIKEGDYLTIKKEFMGRGGQSGLVLHVSNEGACLDFFTCGICGSVRCLCYTSQGLWEWPEIEAP